MQDVKQIIIDSLKTANCGLTRENLNIDMRLGEVPGMDSMTVINFQMDLSDKLGISLENIDFSPNLTLKDLSGKLEELLKS